MTNSYESTVDKQSNEFYQILYKKIFPYLKEEKRRKKQSLVKYIPFPPTISLTNETFFNLNAFYLK
ncbi:hypothetical protein, partial [Enterococcus hirae]|uniref:hypothetical protein n=1 Tax=Enterococcus hirae TaxID=1354 RepID=UPI0019D4C4A5